MNAALFAWMHSTYGVAVLCHKRLTWIRDPNRLDDVMECSPADTLPQRQHWSRQSLCEPLTAFAAHVEEVSDQATTWQGMDSSQSARRNPTQCVLCHQSDTAQSWKNTVPIDHETPQLPENPDALSTEDVFREHAVDCLDRSCSAMSLS